MIPRTFHVKSAADPEFQRFRQIFMAKSKKSSAGNVWIVKPGENSNRGKGIRVTDDLYDIIDIISYPYGPNGYTRTFII